MVWQNQQKLEWKEIIMNNAIDLALTTITNEIPPDVLAYVQYQRGRREDMECSADGSG